MRCRRPPSHLIRSLLIAAMLSVAAARADVATVDAVKAAYLQKFPLFAEWPAGRFDDAASPLVLGVIGADEVFKELSRQAVGRKVAGRALQVRRFVQADAADPPHLLYIGPEARPSPALMEALLAKHVLTVGATSAAAGAIVNFTVKDERVRFEVSLEAAHKAGIKLSSRLLQVADKVHGVAP